MIAWISNHWFGFSLFVGFVIVINTIAIRRDKAQEQADREVAE